MITAADIMRKDFTKVDVQDTIATFLGAIKKSGDNFCLIFDGKSYCGIADKKELLRSRIDAEKMKMRQCLKHVPLLTESTKLADIVRLLAAADVRALPVRDKNKIVGIVRAKDVVNELRDFYKNVRASDVMKSRLVICKGNDEIGKVMNMMTQRKIDRVPVVDNVGRLIGIVSLVDILVKLSILPRRRLRAPRAGSHNQWGVAGFQIGDKENLLKCPISNEMSTVCCNCGEKDNVATVIDVMSEHDLSSIIVVENDKPVGIITLKDLFEFYRKRA